MDKIVKNASELLDECVKDGIKDVIKNSVKNFFDYSKKIHWINNASHKSDSGNRTENVVKKESEIILIKKTEDVNECYTEKELREIFDEVYDSYNKDNLSKSEMKDQKEKLYKEYEIFARDYMKYLCRNISFGEKRILERQVMLEKKIELGKKSLEKNKELLDRLCKDIDTPIIEICYQDVKINAYDYEYILCDNMIKLSEEICDKSGDSLTYAISFLTKNIGKTYIDKICIDKFKAYLCHRHLDNPEEYICAYPITTDEKPGECSVVYLPDSEQKLHFIINMNSIDIDDDEEFEKDRLYVEFDMKLKGEKSEIAYHYEVFLSKKSPCEEIDGSYFVDSVYKEIL